MLFVHGSGPHGPRKLPHSAATWSHHNVLLFTAKRRPSFFLFMEVGHVDKEDSHIEWPRAPSKMLPLTVKRRSPCFFFKCGPHGSKDSPRVEWPCGPSVSIWTLQTEECHQHYGQVLMSDSGEPLKITLDFKWAEECPPGQLNFFPTNVQNPNVKYKWCWR